MSSGAIVIFHAHGSYSPAVNLVQYGEPQCVYTLLDMLDQRGVRADANSRAGGARLDDLNNSRTGDPASRAGASRQRAAPYSAE